MLITYLESTYLYASIDLNRYISNIFTLITVIQLRLFSNILIFLYNKIYLLTV